MKNAKRWMGMLAAGFVLFGMGFVFAQDWPQWRGPNRDGQAAGFTAPQAWPEALAPKWQITVGTGDATPALAGGKLYVFTRQGEEEVTLCVNADNGEKIWEDRYEAQAVTGAAARHPGPRSSPTVAGGKVITLGVGGVLSCLDASSGKVMWRQDPFPKVVPRFFTSMSPLVVDGLCMAQLGGAGNGALMAFDLETGQEKWRWSEEGPEYASPVLLTVAGTRQVVALTEKSIVGLGAADGKLLWKQPFAPQGRAYNAATPIVAGETVIYTGSGRGARAVKIEKEGDAFVPKEIWNNPDIAPQFNTPVLKDGLLFGLSDKGNLYCVNAQTGETAWLDPVQRDRSGFAAVVGAGPVLLALPSSGEMIVFEPTNKQYAELARLKVSGTPVFAHPVVAGNRIFVKDQETLAMSTLP